MKKTEIGFWTIVFWTFASALSPVHAKIVLQNLDYSDALEEIENPHIGFYRPVGMHFTPEGNKPTNTWGNLTHLRMDISAFSDNAVLSIDKTTGDTTFGVSQPLTADMLNAFETILNNVRSRGKTAIVRFAYDPWYNGTKNCDPDQKWILHHLKQLGEVYARNTDVITFVELGMYGSWGEMHSSANATNENIAEALQTLLACTPPEIKVGVRRPDIVAYWLKVNDGNNYSGFDINSDQFQQALAEKGDTIYRVGMYNDGYLGSSSDLGTIGMGANGHQMTREMMVNWLEAYSHHTPYGGELVANYNGDHPINTPAYLSEEGFRTHTSYLNYEWHQPTILGWKDTIFQGDDAEYKGSNGYIYVVNHLGYRFILRQSLLPDSVCLMQDIPVELTIENVGFANLTKSKQVTFILSNGEQTYELKAEPNLDATTWLSQEKTVIKSNVGLPSEMSEGIYEMFIRISENGDFPTDNNQNCIQFGNPSTQYNKTFGANRIGKIRVCQTPPTKSVNAATDEPSCYMEGGMLHISHCNSITIYSAEGKMLLQKYFPSTVHNTIPLNGITSGKPCICIMRDKNQTVVRTTKLVK